MKCISRRGYTYIVYDKGDGRVFKKEKPLAHQYVLHLSSGHTPRYVHMHKRQAALLLRVFAGADFLAKPERISNRSYSQETVTILDEYFATHSLEENKRAVDAYIEHIFATWRHGFSDIIFNCTRNCGVLPDGTVALVDFNEVTFSKDAVAEKLRETRWGKAFSYTKDLQDGPLKAYYAEVMAKAMTIEHLNQYWKDNAELLEKTQ
jgi:hypothetical protein